METSQSTTEPERATPAVPEAISAPETKLVYVYLQVTDGCTVDELCRNLDMRKLSLFPVLDTLRERGLIAEGDVERRRS